MRRLIVLVTVTAMSLLGLVTLGGAAANATTPGKNGLIVFSADTGSGFQLYTIKPNGSGLSQLTNLNNNPPRRRLVPRRPPDRLGHRHRGP
jgi:hypothetical protein